MQITHEEARRLIQFNADEALSLQEKTILSTHLVSCFECRDYAHEILNVERTLSPLMKRQWNIQPAPLSINGLIKRKNTKSASSILAIRTMTISLVFIMFLFGFWQFTLLDRRMAGPSPAGLLPVPTPSIESTSTRIIFENCEMMVYIVQQNDTLASIASQFSVPQKEIMAINGLRTETINAAMRLMIPSCNFTPTRTADPAILTTTFTPVTNPSVSPSGPNG